jgi:hypothetical protein
MKSISLLTDWALGPPGHGRFLGGLYIGLKEAHRQEMFSVLSISFSSYPGHKQWSTSRLSKED